MATIAEFSLPSDSFALAETLPEYPDVAVEADRMAAHVPDSTMPCIWATDTDVDGFSEAIAADRTVKEIMSTAKFDGERLYHLQWSDEIDQLVTGLIDHQGVILEASGRADQWLLRIRFMSREQFQHFKEYFEEHGPSFRLEQLFEAKHPRHTRGDVTPEQHEALKTAVEVEYFQIPRNGSIQDIADELEVSDQAVSERIRRGTENLVRDMLTTEPIQDRS